MQEPGLGNSFGKRTLFGNLQDGFGTRCEQTRFAGKEREERGWRGKAHM